MTIFSDFVNPPLDAATASMHLALGLQMCGQEDDACEVASIALEDYLVYLGENHPDVAQAHLFLASIYSEKDLATCITMIEKALTVRTNLFGELHPQVAACYSQLSATYLADFSKRPSPYSFDQAIAHAKQALDVHLALPESEHSMRADCYYRLEQIYTTGAQKSSQYNNYSSLIQFYRRKAAEAYQAHLLWKNSLLTPTSNPQKPKRKPRPKPQKKRKK